MIIENKNDNENIINSIDFPQWRLICFKGTKWKGGGGG
jgi:hypothetical protein